MSDYNFAYSAGRQALGDTYSASAAKNAYAQFLARTRGARNIEDLTRQYQQKAPQLVNSFAKRGLVGGGIQSGVYQNALNKFASQNMLDVTRAKEDLAGQIRQAELDMAGITADYNRGLVDLEQKKISDMAQQAAMLKSFKPFIGG